MHFWFFVIGLVFVMYTISSSKIWLIESVTWILNMIFLSLFFIFSLPISRQTARLIDQGSRLRSKAFAQCFGQRQIKSVWNRTRFDILFKPSHKRPPPNSCEVVGWRCLLQLWITSHWMIQIPEIVWFLKINNIH